MELRGMSTIYKVLSNIFFCHIRKVLSKR